MVSEELQVAIALGYETFKNYRLNGSLNVCPCCVSEENVASLISTPLENVSAKMLEKWTGSAGPLPDDEVRYFLPRCFHLIAGGESTSSIDDACNLTPLEECQWESWPENEIFALRTICRSILRDACKKGSPVSSLTFESVLISMARIRFNFLEVLDEIRKPLDKQRLAEVLLVTKNMSGKKFNDPFWSMTTKGSEHFIRWLYATETLQATMNAIDSVEHLELNPILESAFDYLTCE